VTADNPDGARLRHGDREDRRAVGPVARMPCRAMTIDERARSRTVSPPDLGRANRHTDAA
jgi:hypothetical protein